MRATAPAVLIGLGMVSVSMALLWRGPQAAHARRTMPAAQPEEVDAPSAHLAQATLASEALVDSASRGDVREDLADEMMDRLLAAGAEVARPLDPHTRSALLVPAFNLRRAADLLRERAPERESHAVPEAYAREEAKGDIVIRLLSQPDEAPQQLAEEGLQHFDQDRYADAEAISKVLEALGPEGTRFSARLLRGLCLIQSERLEEGVDTILTACRWNREHRLAPAGLYWAGSALLVAGETKRACGIFGVIRSRYPGTPQAASATQALSRLSLSPLRAPYIQSPKVPPL
jgi:TolA-binding protein